MSNKFHVFRKSDQNRTAMEQPCSHWGLRNNSGTGPRLCGLFDTVWTILDCFHDPSRFHELTIGQQREWKISLQFRATCVVHGTIEWSFLPHYLHVALLRRQTARSSSAYSGFAMVTISQNEANRKAYPLAIKTTNIKLLAISCSIFSPPPASAVRHLLLTLYRTGAVPGSPLREY